LRVAAHTPFFNTFADESSPSQGVAPCVGGRGKHRSSTKPALPTTPVLSARHGSAADQSPTPGSPPAFLQPGHRPPAQCQFGLTPSSTTPQRGQKSALTGIPPPFRGRGGRSFQRTRPQTLKNLDHGTGRQKKTKKTPQTSLSPTAGNLKPSQVMTAFLPAIFLEKQCRVRRVLLCVYVRPAPAASCNDPGLSPNDEGFVVTRLRRRAPVLTVKTPPRGTPFDPARRLFGPMALGKASSTGHALIDSAGETAKEDKADLRRWR